MIKLFVHALNCAVWTALFRKSLIKFKLWRSTVKLNKTPRYIFLKPSEINLNLTNIFVNIKKYDLFLLILVIKSIGYIPPLDIGYVRVCVCFYC